MAKTKTLQKEKINSWYFPTLDFSPKQEKYIEMLEELFNVPNYLKEPIPYKMVDYQKQYHSLSLNVLGEKAPDILFEKARGISFTTSTMIDMIVTATGHNDQLLPIISGREQQALDILKLTEWLAENANVDIKTKSKTGEILFEDTGTIIRAYPSNSASDATRGLRLIKAMIDEGSRQRYLDEALTSVKDAMNTEFSQVVLGSTHAGRATRFYELTKDSRNWKLFSLPIFNPDKFDVNKPIPEQNLTPLAPWISLKRLEDRRLEDKLIFEQEFMCKCIDDSTSYFPLQLIEDNTYAELKNYTKPVQTENPLIAGGDVATTHDWAVITIFEITEFGLVQRHLKYFAEPVKLPTLQAIYDDYVSDWNLTKARVDYTGLGMQLGQYLQQKYGSVVEPINFASRTKVASGISTPIKERMSTNLKSLLQDRKIKLLSDIKQTRHLNVLDYNLKAPSSKKDGHADIAWAVMLACLPLNFRALTPTPMYTSYDAVRDKEEDKEEVCEKETFGF